MSTPAMRRRLYWGAFGLLWLSVLAMTLVSWRRWEGEVEQQEVISHLLEERALLEIELEQLGEVRLAFEARGPAPSDHCPIELAEELFLARVVRAASEHGLGRLEYRILGDPIPVDSPTGEWRVRRQEIELEFEAPLTASRAFLRWLCLDQPRLVTVDHLRVHREVPHPSLRIRIAIYAATPPPEVSR